MKKTKISAILSKLSLYTPGKRCLVLLMVCILLLGAAGCGKKASPAGESAGAIKEDAAAADAGAADSENEESAPTELKEPERVKPIGLSKGRIHNIQTYDDTRAIAGEEVVYYYLSESYAEKYPELAKAIAESNEGYIEALTDFGFAAVETAYNTASEDPTMFPMAEDVFQVTDLPFYYQAEVIPKKCDEKLVSLLTAGSNSWEYGGQNIYSLADNYDPATGEKVYIDRIVADMDAFKAAVAREIETNITEDSYFGALKFDVDGYFAKMERSGDYSDVKYYLDYSGLVFFVQSYSDLCPELEDEIVFIMEFQEYPDLVREEYLQPVEGYARETKGSFDLDIDENGLEELVILEHEGHEDPLYWNNIGVSYHYMLSPGEYRTTDTVFLDIKAYDPVILYGMTPGDKPFLLISSKQYGDEVNRALYLVALEHYEPEMRNYLLNYSLPVTGNDPLGDGGLTELPGDISAFRLDGYNNEIEYAKVSSDLYLQLINDPVKMAEVYKSMESINIFGGEPKQDADTVNVCAYDYHWEWADSDGYVMMTVNFTIPQLTERSMTAGIINSDLEKFFTEDLAGHIYEANYDLNEEDLSWWKDMNGEGNEYPMYTCDMGYRVTYRDDKYLCIVISGYDYSGGAHGMPYEYPLIYSLTDGQRVSAEELFDVKDEAEFTSIVNDGIMKYISWDDGNGEWIWKDPEPEEEDIPLWDDTPGMVAEASTFDSANYYLTDEGTVFYFSPYHLNAFAFGFRYATIPYSVLPLK